MDRGRAADAAKNARKAIGKTQQQLSFDIPYSREAISKQEHGEYRVQPTMAEHYAENHQNPWVGYEAASQYTSWGVGKLDGPAVDLHRCSTAIKTQEELQEAIDAIHEVDLTTNPKTIQDFEKEILERAIQESLDAITALTHYVAIICREYGFSWVKMWTKHKMKLISRGFLKKGAS